MGHDIDQLDKSYPVAIATKYSKRTLCIACYMKVALGYYLLLTTTFAAMTLARPNLPPALSILATLSLSLSS